MSVYTYNNVTLQHCRTLEFRVESKRDSTNTDHIYNEYTVRVRGFVATSQGAFPGVGDSLSTAATLALIKAQLETPRRSFTYSIAGTTLVSVGQGFATLLDAKIGPDPQPAVVREVTSGTFLVEHGVTCRVVDCDNQCDATDPVLSLRWTQTESFDENWFSHLTTQGRLIVRSDLLQSADNFRALATPGILPDYQRKSSKYTLSPDGLELEFQFEDVEVDRLPPYPATKASGSFTVMADKTYKRVGQVNVHLEGPKGTSRATLMVRALAMCYSKLGAEGFRNPFPGGDPAKSIPLVWGTFREDLFAPVVDVVMNAMLPPLVGGGGFGWLSAAAGALAGVGKISPRPVAMPTVGEPPAGVASGRSGLTLPQRKRLAGLLTAAFRDPCACLAADVSMTSTGTSTGDAPNPDIVSATANYPAEITIADLSSLPPSAIPLVTDGAPYDTYQIETTTNFNEGVVQMPGTGVGDDGGASAIMTVSGGFTTMIVNWVAGRTGKPPVLPVYNPNILGITPLGGSVVAQQTVPSPDGTALVFMMAGYYMYAVGRITEVQLSSVQPPYVTEQVNQGASQGAGFWANLLNLVPKPTGANPFVPGGVTEGVTNNADPLGQGNLPLAQIIGLGGFQDLGGLDADDPKNDPFFNSGSTAPFFIVPKVNP
jgi:hypothetical protein